MLDRFTCSLRQEYANDENSVANNVKCSHENYKCDGREEICSENIAVCCLHTQQVTRTL